MGDGTKQVRVDNWGIFFLQRLQMFFSKTDYCDMTLQFEGNVQLKVHRLVMNACTEYFQFLEQTCTLEDNIIMMPSDLQADVIVPIVNFMYTGMLEFHLSIFEKLYKTAQTMNITILTKLLDAQKLPVSQATRNLKKKQVENSSTFTPVKKPISKPVHHTDLPAPLPGRKLPVWKRKSIPTPSSSFSSHSTPPVFPSEVKWTSAVDPLSVPDNTPKPTRFEWPDEDLPTLSLMDTSFEEISYTSKPLLTQEEEQRATTSFDDIRNTPSATRSILSSKKSSNSNLDMEEMKNYVKEQKIRSGLSQEENTGQETDAGDVGQKRKATDQKGRAVIKKVRFDEQDNNTTTISIATDGKGGGELNHEKIVAEILKKYPHLVKKNKNIKLKIMAKKAGPENKIENSPSMKTPKVKITEIQKPELAKPTKPRDVISKTENKAPWICDRCSTEDEPVEFILYYLYRKHMTDVHNEKFDPKLCKYCGHKCSKQNLLMYHLYTKHGMKPPPGYNFPKCDQCPFIALSANILTKHKLRHNKNEIQCVECKLAFTSQATLTSHIQITGHTGKSNKSNYDCQYCTKRYQSGTNLFSHVRMQHRNEAVRDGIVSIDEMDEMEEYDEEETIKDEYILPEIISDSESTSKKVTILSDVKVQDRQQHHSRHPPLSLEPSSEAEALNNVASGIATSLGLVDIVVLNDNQQIFLQPNQQTYTNDQHDQPEFILPELTGRETFVQTQNEVITTDGVITQSMLSSGDIGSTDELVMVLTDHDYGDNQEEINNDNSNIVVLYSHPVDGQQDQFITSQGNLMVNSQGLLEIRNGATITSTANQVVMNPQEAHIESIEMIQREIESHGEVKQEALYDEDTKPVVQEIEKPENQTQEKEQEPVIANRNSDTLIENLTQGGQLELTSPLVSPEELSNSREVTEEQQPVEEDISSKDNQQITVDTPVNEEADKNEPEAPVIEENDHVEESDPKNEEVVEQLEPTQDKETFPVLETAEPVEEQTQKNVEESEELPHQEDVPAPPDENESVIPSEKNDECVPADENEESVPAEENDKSIPVEKNVESTPVEEYDESIPPEEIQQVPTQEGSTQTTEESNENQEENNEKIQEPVVESEKETESLDDNSKTDMMEIDEEAKESNEEEKEEQELSQSDTSTSQFNDENSQSSQEQLSRKENQQDSVATKISILDDWEDTDSQNSDHKEKSKEADETVHKLMDDWEEEEEDDSRKG